MKIYSYSKAVYIIVINLG